MLRKNPRMEVEIPDETIESTVESAVQEDLVNETSVPEEEAQEFFEGYDEMPRRDYSKRVNRFAPEIPAYETAGVNAAQRRRSLLWGV